MQENKTNKQTEIMTQNLKNQYYLNHGSLETTEMSGILTQSKQGTDEHFSFVIRSLAWFH